VRDDEIESLADPFTPLRLCAAKAFLDQSIWPGVFLPDAAGNGFSIT
jgi:hypothetical protein